MIQLSLIRNCLFVRLFYVVARSCLSICGLNHFLKINKFQLDVNVVSFSSIQVERKKTKKLKEAKLVL